jgi:hypothetical protein
MTDVRKQSAWHAATAAMAVAMTVGIMMAAGCGSVVTPPTLNQSPIADAGAAQTVSVGSAVTLSARSSSDPDGDLLTYAWTLAQPPTGSAAALSSTTAMEPTFTPDIAGTYVFAVTVSDGRGGTDQDSVQIVAEVAPGDQGDATPGDDQNGLDDDPADPGAGRPGDAPVGGDDVDDPSDPADPGEDFPPDMGGEDPAIEEPADDGSGDGDSDDGDDGMGDQQGDDQQGDEEPDDNVLPPPPAHLAITSTFETDDEGWRVLGGPFTEPTRPTYDATNGHPDGHVWVSGSEWYWLAPAKFLGDLSAAYGQCITFELNQAHYDPRNTTHLLVLDGGGHRIHYNGPYAPTRAWTGYCVRLDETEFWWDSTTGERVTASQLMEVLGNLSQLQIRGWSQWGVGEGGLDDVAIHLEPLPPTTAPQIQSTFDDDAEGWLVAQGTVGRAGVVSHTETEGVPGGAVSALGGGWMVWIAPEPFLGNVSAAYGQTLSFDLNQSYSDARNAEGMVVLIGGGHRLAIDAYAMPVGHWSGYSFLLEETAPWINESGSRATETQMRETLAHLQQIHLRAWCQWGEGTSRLDNVRLELADGLTPIALQTIRSTFEAGDEGWTIGGGDLGLFGPVAWAPDAGSIGGALEAGGGNRWYWVAPPKFRGDLSGAYGQALRFSLRQEWYDARNGDAQVIIDGGGYSIVHHSPYFPDETWTSYSIGLIETEEWWHRGSGQRVTQAEMRAVLADVQQIKIRGQYMWGAPKTWLDEVEVQIAP